MVIGLLVGTAIKGASAANDAHNASQERKRSERAAVEAGWIDTVVYDYLLELCEPRVALQLKRKLYTKLGIENTIYDPPIEGDMVRGKLQQPASREFVYEHLRQLERMTMEAELAGIRIGGRVCRTALNLSAGGGRLRDQEFIARERNVPLGTCGTVAGFTISSDMEAPSSSAWSVEVSFPKGTQGRGIFADMRNGTREGKFGAHVGLIHSVLI